MPYVCSFYMSNSIIEFLVKDNAGNTNKNEPNSFVHITVADNVAPTVTFTGPLGTIAVNDPIVTGTVTDAAPSSGISSAKVNLKKTGFNQDFTCTVDGSGNISCPTSGLLNGTYNAIITAADVAGNSASTAGSFTVDAPCEAEPPSLSIHANQARWANVSDYVNRLISVDIVVDNMGSGTAYDVKMVSSITTNNATLKTAVPASLGDIAGGSSHVLTLKYKVPVLYKNSPVTTFEATVNLTARNLCNTPKDFSGQASIILPLLPI